MSYLDGVPTYVYELPCGHEFRSRTESHADDGDGLHWFYCERCRGFSCVSPANLTGGRPLYASGKKRIGDYQLSVLTDSGIQKDRIAAYYRNVWDSMSVREVAEALDVQREHVECVSIDLGVYESMPRDLGDHYR